MHFGRRLTRSLALLLALGAWRLALAQVHPIENVAPDAIEAYVAASKGTLIINVTSTDPRCGYCMQANVLFDRFSRRHDMDEAFQLAQVAWQPWPRMPEAVQRLLKPYGVNGIPVQLVFVDGKFQHKTVGVPPAVPPESPQKVTGDVPLADRQHAAERIAASRGVLLVQLTSFETTCAFCMRSNPIFEDLVKHNDDPAVHFLRVAYTPWTRVTSDPFAQTFQASGLPLYLTFQDGKLVRSKPGSWDVDVLHKELLDGLH